MSVQGLSVTKLDTQVLTVSYNGRQKLN